MFSNQMKCRDILLLLFNVWICMNFNRKHQKSCPLQISCSFILVIIKFNLWKTIANIWRNCNFCDVLNVKLISQCVPAELSGFRSSSLLSNFGKFHEMVIPFRINAYEKWFINRVNTSLTIHVMWMHSIFNEMSELNQFNITKLAFIQKRLSIFGFVMIVAIVIVI